MAARNPIEQLNQLEDLTGERGWPLSWGQTRHDGTREFRRTLFRAQRLERIHSGRPARRHPPESKLVTFRGENLAVPL